MKNLLKLVILIFLMSIMFACSNHSKSLPKASITSISFNEDYTEATFQLSITDNSSVISNLYYQITNQANQTKEGNIFSLFQLSNDKTKVLGIELKDLTPNERYTIEVYADYQISNSEIENSMLVTYEFEATKEYDAAIKLLGATYDYDGQPHSLELINAPEDSKVLFRNNGHIDAGTYLVIAEIYQNNELYIELSAVLQIKKITPIISIQRQEYSYTGMPQIATYSISNNGVCEVTYNGSKNLPTEVGEYEVVVAYPGSKNYEAVKQTSTLEITKADITVTLDSYSSLYDGEEKQITPNFSIQPENYTIDYKEKTLKDVGVYELDIIVDESYNYNRLKTTLYYTITETLENKEKSLFFSKIALLNGTNDVFEIYNPTDSTISLDDYAIEVINGSYYSLYQLRGAELASGQSASFGNSTSHLIHLLPMNYVYRFTDVNKQSIINLVYGDSKTMIDTIQASNLGDESLLERKVNISKGNTTFDSNEWYALSAEEFVLHFNQHEVIYTNEIYPQITIVGSNHQFNYGDELDLSKYIRVYDFIDHEIDLSKVVYDEVDTEILGAQEINISYTNSFGKTTSVKFSFTILDLEGPKISTEEAYFRYEVADTIGSLTELFTVTDNYDGPIEVTEENITYNNINRFKSGTYQVRYQFEDSNGNVSEYVIQIQIGSNAKILSNIKTLSNIKASPVMSSLGDVHILVVPVQFSNLEGIIHLDTVEKSFNTTNSYSYSVKEFIKQSSYDKMNPIFDIQSVYQPLYSSTYYNNETGYDLLAYEYLSAFEKTNDLSIYDNNNDGYIDGIYFIINNDVSYTNNKTSYSYNRYKSKTLSTSKQIAAYCITSYSYLPSEVHSDNKINIYLFGCLLGLSDFKTTEYGYALGGSSIMDDLSGDFTSFEKMTLGWVKPQVITRSSMLTLEKGQVILIGSNINSIYSEYILVDFYPKNEYEEDLFGNAEYGVRIYHIVGYVNALGDFIHNTWFTDYPMIRLLEADYNGHFDIFEGGFTKASDLYYEGDTFGIGAYSNYRMYQGGKLGFTLKVLSLEETKAKLYINMK